jgi:hypothetical protein
VKSNNGPITTWLVSASGGNTSTSARRGASGKGGKGAPHGGNGGVVGAGTAGGGNGKIDIESEFGPITLNGNVSATGSAGGDVTAKAGDGGFGTDSGGDGGAVAPAGSGGTGGQIQILARKNTLTINNNITINANGGNGGNQSGQGGDGGNSYVKPGKGGGVGPAGAGGGVFSGTPITISKRIVGLYTQTAVAGDPGQFNGKAGADGRLEPRPPGLPSSADLLGRTSSSDGQAVSLAGVMVTRGPQAGALVAVAGAGRSMSESVQGTPASPLNFSDRAEIRHATGLRGRSAGVRGPIGPGNIPVYWVAVRRQVLGTKLIRPTSF